MACPDGMIKPDEIPKGWGLLLCQPGRVYNPVKPDNLPTEANAASVALSDIARACSGAMMNAHGVRWVGMEPQFPSIEFDYSGVIGETRPIACDRSLFGCEDGG